MSAESINMRIHRLNNLILSQTSLAKNKFPLEVLSRESLLDALFILYNECNKDNLKKRDKNIAEFVAKYRNVVNEVKLLRLNIEDFFEKGLIGKGFFGSVYLVSEKVTGDLYAMKKIKKNVVNALQVKEERDIMSRRCSKWITNLQYSFQDTDFLYLIMEYLPGGDLLSLMIRNGPFEEDAIKFYIAEILLALNDLHTMGFVHRDIKPENILIDRVGHIKLADFGNATAVNRNGSVFSLLPVGTPYYIAPELLQTISCSTKFEHDVTCDFWSVGVIAYEMVYETTPFYNENIHETYSKILKYCEEFNETEKIVFPCIVPISNNFKSLIENLVNKPSKRSTFSKIKNHKFFENTKWDSLHEQIPPYIPFLKSEDDTSNFEDAGKIREKQSTYPTKNIYLNSNDFCGKDLPFLGYGFVHEEKFITAHINETSNEAQIYKLTSKIQELEAIKNNQMEEIAQLHNKLLIAEEKAKQSYSTGKILSEAKDEIIRMKEMLKTKTTELAHFKTEIKTLRNSLKIEEEHRLKSDATISEVLSSTYKKWEKAKAVSDQNYEKQIAEKKTEIVNLQHKLSCKENELVTKYEEVKELSEKVSSFNKSLQNMRDKTLMDKKGFDEIKLHMAEAYDNKLNDLEKKLKSEENLKNIVTNELKDTRHKLEESIQLANNNLEAKLTADKRIKEIEDNLKKEIELKNSILIENSKIKQLKSEIEKTYENLLEEHEKLKQENCLREISKSLNFESGSSSQYESATGSLTELHKIEEQLRSDLVTAKEEESRQRCRADQLEKIVAKLEYMVNEINGRPKLVENVLEKQNEKLEDKLALIREQVVIERQSARTANLSLWKMEKQLEEVKSEKKIIQRRLELTETKVERIQNQKRDIELRVKELESFVKQKDERIEELQEKVRHLNSLLQDEQQACQNAEKECMKLKCKVSEQNIKIQKLNEEIGDSEKKIFHMSSTQDCYALENKNLQKELDDKRDHVMSLLEQTTELQTKLKSSQENYNLLKIACSITDQQLTDVEILLNAEIEKNKLGQEKIENLKKSIREKVEMISQLKQDLNLETSKKLEAENKIKTSQLECDELVANVGNAQMQLISQKKYLTDITNDLFTTQEKLEIATSELNNIQTINKNFEREMRIMKEESTRILTELFLAKESNSILNQELKISNQGIHRLEEENKKLHNSLEEQRNLYMQKDVKSEATLTQHKKLIDYLQLKLEDLSQKKKKSLTDKFFGGMNAADKKENLNPNSVESSILYRTLQEELNREKQKNKTLQEQLEKLRNVNQIGSFDAEELTKQKLESVKNFNSHYNLESTNMDSTANERVTDSNELFQNCHRFELNLNSNNTNLNCIACSSIILRESPYWFCKECKCTVHRKCRSKVNKNCNSFQNQVIEFSNKKPADVQSYKKFTENKTDNFLVLENGYYGEFVLSGEKLNPPLEINCACNLTQDHILLGTKSGLYAFELTSDSLLRIPGVENVESFSVSLVVEKILIAANDGDELLQCDLKQLQNYVQKARLNATKLEIKKVDLCPLLENHNKFYLTAISNIHEGELAVVAGAYQVIVMKFDVDSQSFKLLHSCKISTKVTAILFTHHSVIISADKFLKIDLRTYTMEEFIDFSDPTLNHLQNYQSMNIFSISAQEYLICFTECGIFVDEYGCRSRPYELTWEYTPTNFLYQEPFLFISHFQLIQILRLHRSYRNEIENHILNVKRVYLNLYMPNLLGPSGNHNCFALTVNRNTGIQEVLILNGLEALKRQSLSNETLSSQGTCLTFETESSNTS